MIRFADATTLALTKLRTRKIRLTITIIISGLLFGGLAGASLVARGVMNGVREFGKEGLGSRYIAQAYGQASTNFLGDKAVLDRATAIQKDIVARKKAEAKRLGIAYDPAGEQQATQEYDTPTGKEHSLNPQHPAARQAVIEYLAMHPLPGLAELKTAANPYHPKALYTSKVLPGFDLDGAQLQVLKGGQESFGQAGAGKTVMYGPPTGVDSFIGSWSTMSRDLLTPFILPGQNLKTGSDGSIPIIVPRSAAEQILELKALPASAKPAERLARTKEIRAKAPNIKFSVCYRNSTSADLVRQAVATKQEIEQNKHKKDYQKPSLIYGLPSTPCGSVPVARDVRSKDEKTLADKQRQFNELFGTPPPEQQTLSFRIVGIVPDPDSGNAFGVGQIVSSLVSSSLGSGWYTPVEETDAHPLLNKLFNQTSIFGGGESFYAEFSSAEHARHFIDQESCSADYSKLAVGEDPMAACLAKHKPFSINAYGSNSLALESAKRGFGKIFGIAALVVAGIAAIIMMGTVGRMIADSRRETAVFRAIGAKKLDIAQVYVLYAICLSLFISAFAIVLGTILAGLVDSRWSTDVTLQAITAYNAQNLDKTFSLYAFYLPDLLILTGLALAAGLLSSVFPLIRNLRRNPIRDMRDDT